MSGRSASRFPATRCRHSRRGDAAAPAALPRGSPRADKRQSGVGPRASCRLLAIETRPCASMQVSGARPARTWSSPISRLPRRSPGRAASRQGAGVSRLSGRRQRDRPADDKAVAKAIVANRARRTFEFRAKRHSGRDRSVAWKARAHGSYSSASGLTWRSKNSRR